MMLLKSLPTFHRMHSRHHSHHIHQQDPNGLSLLPMVFDKRRFLAEMGKIALHLKPTSVKTGQLRIRLNRQRIIK